MTPPPPRSSFDKAPKPDIIFILCDQLRADFLSLHGCAAIRTPHIDRLAREGIVYENAVSPQPLCVPARAAMLTGLNPIQSGVISNHHWLRPDRYALGLHTWPDILRDQGYRTASIGKMHFHPFESSEGFDDRIIAEDKRWPLVGDDYAEFLKTRGLEKFNAITHPDYVENQGAVLFPHGTENSPDRFVSMSAADYIRRQPASRPFAMMIGFPGPHCPYDPSEEYLGHVTPDALPPLCPRIDDGSAERTAWHDAFLAENRAAWHALDYATFPTPAKLLIRHYYAALIAQIDEEVGRIVAALEATGRFENALIVFTSDHGDHVGDHDRVGKGTFYEPSVHIPLVVRLPGAAGAGRRVATPVELQRVPATILAAGGADIPPWWNYPALPVPDITDSCGKTTDAERPVCGFLNTGTMIRIGPWKLSHYTAGFSELFNLDEDPTETINRINDPACDALLARLDSALRLWIQASIVTSHNDQRLPRKPALSASHAFGRRGWRQPYPAPLT